MLNFNSISEFINKILGISGIYYEYYVTNSKYLII